VVACSGQRLGEQPLLYVPGKDNFQNEPALVTLSKRVITATWKTLRNPRWGGGPVLAAWPTERHLVPLLPTFAL